jgi:hypothetical protein
VKDIHHALMVAKSIGDSLGLGGRDVLDRADGGYIPDQDKAIRRAVMVAHAPLHRADGGETDEAPKTTVIGGPQNLRPVGSASIKSLSEAFDNAITKHLALPPKERKANSKAAKEALVPFLGKYGELLSANAKLMKAEKGFKGGSPITIPGTNHGVETSGLTLAPSFKEGKFTTCPNSGSCEKDCLGLTSGSNFVHGGGKDLEALKGPRLIHVNKTRAMLRNPEAFAVRLHDEIQSRKMLAAKNGNHLGVRLNVLSDINPRVHKAIIEAHPDVSFYDYTKNNTTPIAPNHHYTYSSTGISHKQGVGGISQDIDNPHQNWKQMRKRLDDGFNVAMPFSHKDLLPENVHDEETGNKYPVIDGDTHDFRPLDAMSGHRGVIVGLRNKNMITKNSPEKSSIQSNGFITHFNPEVSGSNEVVVPSQSKAVPTMTNDMERVQDEQ